MQAARKASLIACAVLVSMVSMPAAARAQDDPTAPFFDDTIVHDIYFTINTQRLADAEGQLPR